MKEGRNVASKCARARLKANAQVHMANYLVNPFCARARYFLDNIDSCQCDLRNIARCGGSFGRKTPNSGAFGGLMPNGGNTSSVETTKGGGIVFRQ